MDDGTFFFCEDFVGDEVEYDAPLAACIEQVPLDHPLKAKLSDMVLDLEFGDEIDLSELDLADILQAVIFESEGAIRCFEVEAALSCNRVLPRQVGGWCSLVTADEVRSMHTGSWLCAQRKACGISDAALMVAFVDKTDTGHA